MNAVVRSIAIVAALGGMLNVAARDGRTDNASVDANAKGVNESMYVRVGGIDQWIQIQGDDRVNPVLLWLNGGPGESTMPFAPAFQPWDHFFTIVMWDQRGEGKTFEKNGESEAPMTVEQMTADGIELTEFLRRHLHKDKIILLGHSWGSVLGIHMIKSRPDLFAAYVGTGQVTHLSSQLEAAYPLLLKRAMLNSEAERELTAIGPPPWKSEDAYDVVNKWGEPFEPPPAPPTEEDRRTWMRLPRPQPQPYIQSGREFSHRMLDDALAKEDLPAIATQFSVPIIFIQGEDDLITATSVVKAYFDRIVSKDKRFIVLPGCGHDAIFRDRARFLAELVAQVRPLAMKSSH